MSSVLLKLIVYFGPIATLVTANCNDRVNVSITGIGTGYYHSLATPEECCDLCKGMETCVAYTLENGKCWPKIGIRYFTEKDNVHSAVLEAACDPNPCHNKGACQTNGTCQCLDSYSGETCAEGGCEIVQDMRIDGAGRFGYRYGSVEECCEKCHRTQDCLGWTDDGEYCWLKTSFKGLKDAPGKVSGLLKSANCTSTRNPCQNKGECKRGGTCKCLYGYDGETCTEGGCQIHHDKAMTGSGYGYYLNYDAPEYCCQKCHKDEKCVGFVYRVDLKRCWLKTSYEGLMDAPGQISGLLRYSKGLIRIMELRSAPADVTKEQTLKCALKAFKQDNPVGTECAEFGFNILHRISF